MSIVSNYIGAIPSNFANQGQNISGTDLDDNTFSDMLNKQMNVQEPQNGFPPTLGIPAGFVENGTNIVDMVSAANQPKETSPILGIDEKEIGTSEMVAFLTKPFDSPSALEKNLSLMDFAKRQASNFYNKCASNVITNLSEFVEDSLKLS
ncbi:hypothetical protein IKQ21_08325 [bacterium]|nr:hypothetical protein [bacterium]